MTSLHIVQAVLVEDIRRFSIAAVTAEIGLQREAFLDLIDCELISVSYSQDEYLLSEESFLKARKAARLAREFGLGPEGLTLAVRLLQRIEELESRLAATPSNKQSA
jgi:chaperone modulatory protein CbpM